MTARDITEYTYDSNEGDAQTSIAVEKFQIGRNDDSISDLVSCAALLLFPAL